MHKLLADWKAVDCIIITVTVFATVITITTIIIIISSSITFDNNNF